MSYEIGTYVKKNPKTWNVSEFDSWGRGVGVAIIVEPPFEMSDNEIDVRWLGGRCFEDTDGILPATKEEYNNQKNID